MLTERVPPDVVICPECEANKHLNCSGDSWDVANDIPAECPCYEQGHPKFFEPERLLDT